MRRYGLVSPEHKQDVDLRDYEDVIVKAVIDVMKDVEGVSVVVYKNYYEVSPSPDRGMAIAIGRAICKSKLNQYCISIPKLFSSVEVSDKKEVKVDRREKNRMAGHT